MKNPLRYLDAFLRGFRKELVQFFIAHKPKAKPRRKP